VRRAAADSNLAWEPQALRRQADAPPQQVLRKLARQKSDGVESFARADAQLQTQRELVAALEKQADAPVVWLQPDLAQEESLLAQQAGQQRASK
jgi:small-conductance mechanosensitive channel